jgi:hypothetical protein
VVSYNASIFKIITQNTYQIQMIDINSEQLPGIRNSSVRLENKEWTKIYNKKYVSLYGDLTLVVDRISFGSTAFEIVVNLSMSEYLPKEVPTMPSPSGEGWINLGPDEISPFGSDALHISEGYTVDLGNNSRIQISLYFLLVVITFNFLKLIIMGGILIADRANYIVTIGDAAASFLEHPDSITKGRCTLNTDEMMASYEDMSRTADTSPLSLGIRGKYEAKAWQLRTRRYCSSIGFDKVWSSVLS